MGSTAVGSHFRCTYACLQDSIQWTSATKPLVKQLHVWSDVMEVRSSFVVYPHLFAVVDSNSVGNTIFRSLTNLHYDEVLCSPWPTTFNYLNINALSFSCEASTWIVIVCVIPAIHQPSKPVNQTPEPRLRLISVAGCYLGVLSNDVIFIRSIVPLFGLWHIHDGAPSSLTDFVPIGSPSLAQTPALQHNRTRHKATLVMLL